MKGVVVKAKKETIQEVDSSTETKNDGSQLFLNAEVSEQTSIDGSTDIYLASELHASASTGDIRSEHNINDPNDASYGLSMCVQNLMCVQRSVTHIIR